MKKLDFRTLKANEIECRVGNTSKDNGVVKGFFLLLYKNARVDQTILDETVGQFNWKCHYYQVKNTMVCSVAIWNEDRQEWVSKDNGGDDDFNAEQVKAELSDSFKRAGFGLGIGRELYYSPKIWIESKGENTTSARYSVKVIEYDKNKRITNLAIINDKTKEVVFLYGKGAKVVENAENEPKTPKENDLLNVNEQKGTITTHDKTLLQDYVAAISNETNRTKVYSWLEKRYGTMSIEMLTKTQGADAVKKLGLE